MSELPPIDRRARELAESGKYARYDDLEVVLIGEYGLGRVNRYRAGRETRRELNEICQQASGEGESD